jgi:hypothetical protein
MAEFPSTDATRDRFRALLDAVDDAHAQMRALSTDAVGSEFRIEIAERLETQDRTNRGLMYRIFGEIADPPDEGGLVTERINQLSVRLRIPRDEAKRRMKVATLIRPRRQLSGPPLAPVLPVVADATEHGLLGEDHLRVIRKTLEKLPSCVSADERDQVEASLVREAARSDAAILEKVGRHIGDIFNPDGHFDEADRARRRGLHLGSQGPDGMSQLRGWIDPETRCYLEACTAAVRPGRHLPDGTLVEQPDDRSPSQRCHDGLKLDLKAGLASGDMGSHRGHPTTVIVRTTLAELNQAAHAVNDPAIPMPGPARTGGDTTLPMRDLIRMAADAIHYLSVFDSHSDRPIYLGRQTRIATTDQRIICYARDGGCTRPGCVEPGYHSEVHHSPDWHPDGATDADMLFFACGPDHGLVSKGRLRTTVTESGRLGWTDGTGPPAVNRVHHPEELLRGDADPPLDAD